MTPTITNAHLIMIVVIVLFFMAIQNIIDGHLHNSIHGHVIFIRIGACLIICLDTAESKFLFVEVIVDTVVTTHIVAIASIVVIDIVEVLGLHWLF